MVIAVIASVITSSITGNTIRVPTSTTTSQTDIYTKAEIDNKLNNMQMNSSFTGGNFGVGTKIAGLFQGASRYLTISATDYYYANKVSSIEIKGSDTTLDGQIARIDFIAQGNARYDNLARIEAKRASGVTEGRLVFSTSGNEKMRIDENGKVKISNLALSGNSTGNAFVCVDNAGNLYRSIIACR